MFIGAQIKQTLALLTNIRLGRKCLQLSYEWDSYKMIYFITLYCLFNGKKGFLIDGSSMAHKYQTRLWMSGRPKTLHLITQISVVNKFL